MAEYGYVPRVIMLSEHLSPGETLVCSGVQSAALTEENSSQY